MQPASSPGLSFETETFAADERSPAHGLIRVAFRAESAGIHLLQAKLRIGTCDREMCRLDAMPLAVVVPAA